MINSGDIEFLTQSKTVFNNPCSYGYKSIGFASILPQDLLGIFALRAANPEQYEMLCDFNGICDRKVFGLIRERLDCYDFTYRHEDHSHKAYLEMFLKRMIMRRVSELVSIHYL